MRSTASQIASTGFSNLFSSLLTGGSSGGGSSGIFGAIASGIGGLFGGGGGAAAATARGAANPALFGPGFASGGDMVLGGLGGTDQNQLSLNGDPIARVGRGESLSIRPAGVSSGGGGAVNVYQTINVSTGVSETVQAELVAFLPVIEKTVKAGVAADQQRGIS